MFTALWFNPPLAFARIGNSPTPLDSFHWGPNDTRPRGTGKTVIVPAETLHLAPDGALTRSEPSAVQFRDDTGVRPVCPWFELHGRWRDGDAEVSGPITLGLLKRFGWQLDDLRWQVRVANLKAFHMTTAECDRIAAEVSLRGDDAAPRTLLGSSPSVEGQRPLVPATTPISLGVVQLARPGEGFEGADVIRLRFTPPPGRVYGPTDLAEREQEGNPITLPADALIADAQAAWCQWRITDDFRTAPAGLFATDINGVSLGLLDDTSDGIIACQLGADGPLALRARTRVVVAPPDYAPDRRPVVSLADGLIDRVAREDVTADEFYAATTLTAREAGDLFERVIETVEAMNLDAQNDRAEGENIAVARSRGLPPEAGRGRAFPPGGAVGPRRMLLSAQGRQQHRRMLSLETLEDKFRENPDLFQRIIRPPGDDSPYYDRRMPALMRNSDRLPLHLTRRQYEFLRRWVARLRVGTGPDT